MTDPFSDDNYIKRYGFKDKESPVFTTGKGISEDVVREISTHKNEPKWMLDIRLKAFKEFLRRPLPTWGPDLTDINFDDITYYVKPADRKSNKWEDVPEYIKKTFDKLGIPDSERKFFAGVGAQYESEVVYNKIREDLSKLGVIFLDTDTALKKYHEFFKMYFGKVVPYTDNKFAALNTAVWSGGSFIYVPKGVRVNLPLQAYFRINAQSMGQFERTLIIADEGSFVHYIEGCTAPVYSKDSLHAAVVEIVALPGSKVRYTTVQNWSKNVYNLVTKRAVAYENAFVEWVDGNIGSKITMKYPSVILRGRGARGDILSVAYASKGQHIDSGAKVIHLACDTASRIVSKSVSKGGGRTSYRGLVKVSKGAKDVKSSVICDALMLDNISRTDTYPYLDIGEKDAVISHEARFGKIGYDKLFYLSSRGIPEADALATIVLGFFEDFVKELPLDYAVEFNRLIGMEMEEAIC